MSATHRAPPRATVAGLVLLGALLLAPMAAVAATPRAPPQPEALADALFAASQAPGLVLVVVAPDGTEMLGRGRQAPGRPQAPDADALLRINSLSKVMAAELFAEALQAGTLRLDTPLARYAQGRPVPGGDALTLQQLATHTGGIPRAMPDADWPVDAAPNTFPDQATRWRWLAQLPAAPAPGRRALYSTPGFLFLGDALAAAAAQPYTRLLAARLTAPLGMRDTTASPDRAQCARLLRAPSDDPLRYACVDSSATAASAGMYSSAHDIGLWMQAMLAREQAGGYLPWQAQRTRGALDRVEGLDAAGHADAIGLGWIRMDADATHPLIVQKTGAGGGFSCYLAFAPAQRRGVFVAASHYDRASLAAMASRVNAWLAEAGAAGQPE